METGDRDVAGGAGHDGAKRLAGRLGGQEAERREAYFVRTTNKIGTILFSVETNWCLIVGSLSEKRNTAP
jgi:hypothetical protein